MRRTGAGLALAAAVLLLAATSPAAAGAVGAAPPSGQKIYSQEQASQNAEAAMASALAAADAALVRARSALAASKRRVAAADQKVAADAGRAAALRASLAAQQSTVDGVVRFLYEGGSASFVQVLLSATSFSDFLTRFTLVERLVSYDVGVLHQVAAARKRLTAALAAERADQRAAAADAARQAKLVADLTREQAARAAALAAAKASTAGFAASLAALDKQLLSDLPQLNTVLSDWPQLPWSAVQPASVHIDAAAGGLDISVTAADLNAVLGISPLQLAIGPKAVTLSAPAPASLLLSGPASIVSGDVVWQPDSLQVGGAPAGAGVLSALLSGRTLRIPLAAPAPGLQLQALHLQAGGLVLVFGY